MHPVALPLADPPSEEVAVAHSESVAEEESEAAAVEDALRDARAVTEAQPESVPPPTLLPLRPPLPDTEKHPEALAVSPRLSEGLPLTIAEPVKKGAVPLGATGVREARTERVDGGDGVAAMDAVPQAVAAVEEVGAAEPEVVHEAAVLLLASAVARPVAEDTMDPEDTALLLCDTEAQGEVEGVLSGVGGSEGGAEKE